MVMNKREGLYMGLILVWAGPFILLLWYDPKANTERKTCTNIGQESCAPIHLRAPPFKHTSSHCFTDPIFMDRGHLCFEKRYLGY